MITRYAALSLVCAAMALVGCAPDQGNNAASSENSVAQAEGTGAWKYERLTDELRGTTVVTATLPSNYVISGTDTPSSHLNIRTGGPNGVQAWIDGGGHNQCIFQRPTLARLDGAPIEDIRCSPGGGAGSTFPLRADFASRLVKAKVLVIEWSNENGVSNQESYTVNGYAP